LAVVILIIQWPFRRFHFRYRDLKVLTEVAFLNMYGERIPDGSSRWYMNDLRKNSQLGFGVYGWLQVVDLVSRHDMSEVPVYET